MEDIFGAFDLGEVFCGDWAAVLDAGGKAGAGGFVGEDEAGVTGQGANFGFGEAGGYERGLRVMEGGGLLTGPKFTFVVEVHAIGDGGETEGGALGFHLGEKFIFAMEAALSIVAGIVGVGKFGRLENLEGDVVLLGESDGIGEFFAGQRGGIGDAGEHAGTERPVSGEGEEGRICAAGIGDEDGAEVLESLVEQG